MVKSILVPEINYKEENTLYSDDIEYDASLYEIELLNNKLIIALGKVKTFYIEDKVVFYPIYMIKNDKVVSQIGLYEIFNAQQLDVLDVEGDIDIDKLNTPLLYEFVNEEFLNKKMEDKPEEMAMKEKYIKEESKNWIDKYMEDNNYDIVDNEGGGDCLFAVIRDGLSKTDIALTVRELREMLSENVTETTYEGYKTQYDSINNEYSILSKEVKDLAKKHKDLKKKLEVTKERNIQLIIVEQGEEIAKRYKEAKKEKEVTNELLKEFEFMEGITSFEAFKAVLQTCKFWGDTVAITTLERVLGIKLILFSQQAYETGDMDNVLLCGSLNDNILEEEAIFKPKYYIMVNYEGWHYKLINYKDKSSLDFNSIPYNVKMMIVNKCLERNAGPYYLIEDFKNLLVKLNKDTSISNINKDIMEENFEKSNLYDDNTVFQFYSKSDDKPKPGKGSGEKLGKEGLDAYIELASIPQWRKKLSNFWTEDFELDGKKWLSVEHYYQGSKFKNDNPEFYNKFSLDSGSQISKEPVLAKAAGGKTGKYKGTIIRPKDVVLDKNYFESGRDKKEMFSAMKAKFTQNEDLKKMLKATKKAKLVHYVRGSPYVTFDNLMEIRNILD